MRYDLYIYIYIYIYIHMSLGGKGLKSKGLSNFQNLSFSCGKRLLYRANPPS
jgi:hypothetical protein